MRQTPSIRIHLFGSLLVEGETCRLGVRDFGGVKPKQVLEILLSARGRPVPKDRLADHLWGEALPRNVPGALESYVSVLRRFLDFNCRLGHELIVTEPEAYRFAVEQVELDPGRFDALVKRATQAETLAEERRCLEEALALARGEVLEDEPCAEWAEPLRDDYRGRVLLARLDAADAAPAEADYQASLAHAEAAVALERFDERALQAGMIASYALGRHHDALRLFNRSREALAEELGLEPTSKTAALCEAIRRHEDLESLLPASIRERSPIRRPADDRLQPLDDEPQGEDMPIARDSEGMIQLSPRTRALATWDPITISPRRTRRTASRTSRLSAFLRR